MHWPEEDVGNMLVALNSLVRLFRLSCCISAAWEAAVLPLNYARDGMRLVERGQGGKGVRGVLGLREGRQVEAMWLGLIFWNLLQLLSRIFV